MSSTVERRKHSVLKRLHGSVGMVLGAVLLASISVTRPTAIGSDPSYWLMWAREITSGTLVTANAWTSGKPLPMPFMVVFDLFGAAAPTLWMIVARAGALIAAGLAFRITLNLALDLLPGDPKKWSLRVPAMLGAAVAAMAILRLLLGWSMVGYSEGLAIALMLAGVECMLNGRHKPALLFYLAACLGRPEPLLAVMIYGLWLWRREPELRKWIVGGPLLVLAAWLVPEWIGSGDPFRAGKLGKIEHLHQTNAGDANPLTAFSGAFSALPVAAAVFLPAGVAAVVWGYRRGNRKPLLLCLIGLGWAAAVALQIALAASGTTHPGVLRYMIPSQAFLLLVIGVGAALVASLLEQGLARVGLPVRAAVGVVATVSVLGLIAAVVISFVPKYQIMQSGQKVMWRATVRLDRAIKRAGGPPAIRACLPIANYTRWDATIAWRVGVTLRSFGRKGSPEDPLSRFAFDHGTTFLLTGRLASGKNSPYSPAAIAPGARLVSVAKPWEVYQRCSIKPRKHRNKA
ncbi:MAG: hypothetical protein NTX07_03455 [Solirubrobacterales bacterium]|nr:hypothetical protein [Solirubrobacterales bacterium]